MSIYKTYILLTNDFIFARGLELEIKTRYKDVRIITGIYENGTRLIDILKKDDAFQSHTIALCDLDAVSDRTTKEIASLMLPCITFSRSESKNADLVRPFYNDALFALLEAKSSFEISGENIEPQHFAQNEVQDVSLYYSQNIDKPTPIYLSEGSLYILGNKIKLSKKEYALISLLLERKGSIVTYSEAASIFSGKTDSNTVNVYIRYLRKKIAEVTSLNVIENIREVGYIIR